jgi:acyl-CoA thioesterase
MGAGSQRVTFGCETEVHPDSHVEGSFRADFSEQWCAPQHPQGGVATVAMIRAMAAALDAPEQTLRSVTNVFAAPVRTGPAEIDVTVLRRGRSQSQVVATMRTPGEVAGHTAVAVFGRRRPGFEFTDVVIPDVPPPEECPSWRDPLPEGVELERRTFSFWENVEGRAAIGHPPWERYQPVSSERANWYRFDEPPRLTDGTLDPLALVVLCDTMPGAVGERMGNDVPAWLPPSLDLTVHLFAPPRSDWVLGYNRARVAGEGYASAEMTLWDPEVGVVAYGTQQMLLVFPEGPPNGDQVFPPGS